MKLKFTMLKNFLLIKPIKIFFILSIIFTNIIYSKTALIFGITGQDGSYLTELLLNKNYSVHGVVRRASTVNTVRIDHLYHNPKILDKKLFLHYGDLTDSCCINTLINKIQPDEIYNLGAQSHVKVSFEVPEFSANVDGLGTLRILDAIKNKSFSKQVKLYQASSSEMFGKVKETPQTELTPFNPRSPYGASKVFAFWITKNYREAYNIFACNGILFNHESPRRGITFVTRKITKAVAEINDCYENNNLNNVKTLHMGNLDSKRDWGHAKDYVKAMWLMLQKNSPSDYVIATNEIHSVRELIELCFNNININIKWRNSRINEEGYDPKTNLVLVKIDPKYFRPTEVDTLLGNSSKANKELNWKPEYNFEKLILEMLRHDIKLLNKNY